MNQQTDTESGTQWRPIPASDGGRANAVRAQGRPILVVLAALTVVLGLAGCNGITERRAAAPEQAEQVIAMLRAVPDEDHDAFVQELRRLGFDPGRSLRILPIDATHTYDDEQQAREALRTWLGQEEDLDLIVAFSTPFAAMVTEEAPGIPTLFVVNEPVAAGLLEHPGEPEGQLTGLTFRTPADRTIDLTAQVLGGLDRIGYLAAEEDPAVPGHRARVLEAADSLAIEVTEASFADTDDIAAAVGRLVEAEVDAVFLALSSTTIRAHPQIEAALDEAGLPAISNSDFAEFAIVVLTPDRAEMRRQLARQAAQLLRGMEVSMVGVEDPRRFATIINASKANELGVPDIDPAFLRQADLVR